MPLAPAALEPLLRLAVVPGIGPGRLSALLSRFGSAERVLAAGAADLAALPGFGPELVRRLQSAATDEGRERARLALEALKRAGAVAVTPTTWPTPTRSGRSPIPRTSSSPPATWISSAGPASAWWARARRRTTGGRRPPRWWATWRGRGTPS